MLIPDLLVSVQHSACNKNSDNFNVLSFWVQVLHRNKIVENALMN